MVEDQAVFFSTAEFASTATLNGVAVVGILDQPYAQVLDGIATSEPMFTLPTAQATSAAQGQTLVVSGITYRVRSVQGDGTGTTGVTMLVLEQVT
jgi:hypothetical protein